MNILILGLPIFKEELAQLGHRVLTAGVAANRDIALGHGEFTLDNVLAHLPPAWRPDVCLLIEELGRRVIPRGLEASPCPLVFYSLDTHLNSFWTRPFATVCDCVLTTQRDFVPELNNYCGQAFWLPWSIVPDEFRPMEGERDLDIAFVGRVDLHRERRRKLLERLSRTFAVHVSTPTEEKWYTSDEISRIFSRAKIVVNEAISAEVNFRVFEAMACGAMLLTEKVGNGLDELFLDGEHLVTFTPFDVMDKADHYLSRHQERERIARAGEMEIAARHTRLARAGRLAEILDQCGKMERRGGGLLGRSYFLMLRRGILSSDVDVQEAERLLHRGHAEEPHYGRRLLDLAEFYGICGEREQALACYAESWRRGEVSFRLLAQWGIALLKAERVDEARSLLSFLPKLAIAGEIGKGLAHALAGEFPSPELFLWLARGAETTDDRYVPGFFSAVRESLPLTGIDFLAEGVARFPDAGELLQEMGDIYLRNGVHVQAASAYLQAICKGMVTADLYCKSALALAHCFRLEDALDQARTAWELASDQRSLGLLNELQKGVMET